MESNGNILAHSASLLSPHEQNEISSFLSDFKAGKPSMPQTQGDQSSPISPGEPFPSMVGLGLVSPITTSYQQAGIHMGSSRIISPHSLSLTNPPHHQNLPVVSPINNNNSSSNTHMDASANIHHHYSHPHPIPINTAVPSNSNNAMTTTKASTSAASAVKGSKPHNIPSPISIPTEHNRTLSIQATPRETDTPTTTATPTARSKKTQPKPRRMRKKGELLNEEEKKANHIASEQKRRQNIKAGYAQLSQIVPTLSQNQRSEAIVLQKTVEYVRYLLVERNILEQQLNTMNSE